VTLAWDMGTESDLAGYRVLRSQTSGGQLTSLSSTLITTSIFTDTSAVNGTTYFYAVIAVDTSGNESDPSAEVSATPEAVTEPTTGAWINEFHYDNDGTDVGEFVEVAGAAGLDLNGWSLAAYNGNGGGAYKTINLSGIIPDLSSGYGVLAFDFGGLQNGSPDGLALVSPFGEVVEFIAYEGDLFAVDGPASGQTAADIGAAETSTTPVGFSLQRAGSSTQGDGFQWSGPLAATPGLINAGQSFAVGDNIPPVAVATEDCNGLECIFDGSGSSDSDGVIVTYSWDFGDGSAATGPLVSHTYSESGEFAVTLTVTDDVGSNGQQVIPVAVTGADALVLSVTGYKVKGRQRVDLLWSGSSTPGIDVYRDGALLAASVTGNSYTDNINIKGGGSYSYKVCESATTTCSADSTVTF
jgi:chitodextrinase